MKTFILLSIFLFFSSKILAFQNATICTGNNFFDTTMMNCFSCYGNQVANSESSCKCANGYRISDSNQIGFEAACIACPTGTAPSSTGKICIACPSDVDPKTGDCKCGDREAVIDIDLNGKLLSVKKCVSCDTQAYPGPLTNASITQCKKCPDGMIYNEKTSPWTCECDTISGYVKAGDKCFLQTTIQSVLTDTSGMADLSITLNDGKTMTLTSDTINFYFVKSAVGCIKYQDDASCQTFANLCVLQLYNERNKICQNYLNYKTASGSKAVDAYSTKYLGWYKHYPWIFYEQLGYQVSQDFSFSETVSFDTSSKFHFLEFYAFKYSLDGTFLGSESLETQLQLCPHSINDGLTYRSLGVNYVNECQLNIMPLFERKNEMIFYDVYIKDRNSNTFIPVPVLLKDFVDSRSDKPNNGDARYFRFVRRFFVFDNVAGIDVPNGYSNGNKASVLRYAKSISFKVSLQDNKEQKIYVPHIEIEYGAAKLAEGLTYFEKISFSTYYEFVTINFFYTIEILFIITNVAIGLLWLLRMNIWIKYNPSKIAPENYSLYVLIKSVFILIEIWGYVIFIFLFCVTAYWFIFFKLQKQVFIFIPPLYAWAKNYYPFVVVFAIMCSFRIFSRLDLIYRQAKIDIFLIDWETPKTLIRKRDQEEEEEIVSVWRTLFIANEFNELQAYRYISNEWTLIILAFFLKGVNWENLAATQPFMSLEVSNVPLNFVLKYFLSSFIFLIIGLVQIIGRRLLNIWLPTSIQNFVDLCSISNISIFLLDETLHGYYIHGKIPGGTAEINAEELEKALDDESKGNSRARGFESDNIHNARGTLQTYEVFIPWEMRMEYNGNYQNHLNMEVTSKNNMRRNADAFGLMIPKALPPGFNFKYIEDKKRNLAKLLKMYIENVYIEKDRYILEKTPYQRLFNYPPVNLDTLKGSPIFLRDYDYGFQKIFFCGNEFSLLLTDISVYEMWDIIFGNTIVAVLMTYLTVKGFEKLKFWLGERNISKKTMVNERFLI